MKLITRADDLGSFNAANVTIDDAVREGICRNASLLAVAHRFEEAVEMFAGRTDVCVGLHSTLTSEWATHRWRPVLPPEKVPCICRPDGTLAYSVHEISERGAVLEQIMAEIRAQLDKVRAAGIDVQYIDTHMAHSWLHEPDHPELRVDDLLRELCDEEGLICYGRDFESGDPGYIVKGKLVPRIYFDASGDDWLDLLCDALRAAATEEIRILVTHPVNPDAEFHTAAMRGKEPGHAAAARERDWQMFAHPRVAAACRAAGIEPIKVTAMQ